MATDEFKATDTFSHRYLDPKILMKYLTGTLKFKKEQIKVQASAGNGLEVALPRKLKPEERNSIFQLFDKSKNQAESDDE